MKRRRFITLVASATTLWPGAAAAQPGDRVRRVGVLMGFAHDDEVWQIYLAAFRQRLQDLGWRRAVTSGSITGSLATTRNASALLRENWSCSRRT